RARLTGRRLRPRSGRRPARAHLLATAPDRRRPAADRSRRLGRIPGAGEGAGADLRDQRARRDQGRDRGPGPHRAGREGHRIRLQCTGLHRPARGHQRRERVPRRGLRRRRQARTLRGGGGRPPTRLSGRGRGHGEADRLMLQRDFLLDVDTQRTLGLDDGAPQVPEEPVRAKLASTVMLLRDDNGPLEVFMMRRVAQMEFAASMHVFPGGGTDPRDAEDELPWAGPEVGEWAELLQTDEAAARMLVAAAVREIFEETGVLLASPAGAEAEPANLDAEDARELRRRLVAKEIGFGQVLLERHLVLRSDLLRYRSHWITPTIEPRRYDTRFFVAAVPVGQDPDGDNTES